MADREQSWVDRMPTNYVEMNLVPISVVITKYGLEGREGSVFALACKHLQLYDDSPIAIEWDGDYDSVGLNDTSVIDLENMKIEATDIPEFVKLHAELSEVTQ